MVWLLLQNRMALIPLCSLLCYITCVVVVELVKSHSIHNSQPEHYYSHFTLSTSLFAPNCWLRFNSLVLVASYNKKMSYFYSYNQRPTFNVLASFYILLQCLDINTTVPRTLINPPRVLIFLTIVNW